MMSISKKLNRGFVSIISALVILAIGFVGLYEYGRNMQNKLGATIPVVVAVFETTLSSKITTADTSMTLVTGTTKSGSTLQGYMCFTISGGKTDEEFVCGTASSTAVTGMIRGLDPVTVATTTALIKEHRAGSNVKITDYPQLAIISRILNGNETVPNTLTYATDTASFTLNQQIINKRYVDSVATSGAAQANYQTSGLVKMATTSELVAGTATTTGITFLVPNAGFFNQTSSATNICPVTNASGKLSTGFIDQTGAYTWSGTTTFSASTTFSATTTISGYLNVTGSSTFSTSTFSIVPTIPATPVASTDAASKSYVDATSTGSAILTAFVITGNAGMVYPSFVYPASSTQAIEQQLNATSFPRRFYVPKAGTVRNMWMVMANALSIGGGGFNCTTTKNSVDTTLMTSVANAGTTSTNSTASFTVIPGDYLGARCVESSGGTIDYGFISVEVK